MIKKKGLILAVGALMTAIGIVGWLAVMTGILYHNDNLSYYVKNLYAAMPECEEGTKQICGDGQTVTYDIDEMDFAGVLEMPDYDVSLPVYGSWDTEKLCSFPCLFYGSAQGGNLVIGSTSDKSFFPFVNQISTDQTMIFTDMTGVRYTYRIADIHHSPKAAAEKIMDEGGDIVLFIKDRTALDYVIINAEIFPMEEY